MPESKRSTSAGRIYKMLYGNLAFCSCLTKTPELKYHDPKCNFRVWMEQEDATDKEKPCSETCKEV